MIKTVIINDTAHANHHGCLRVMRNLQKAIENGKWEVIGSIPVGVPFERHPDNRKLVDSSELVIINGEGSIHHDRPYSISLVNAMEYAKKKNKKVVLINSLWQENSEIMAAKVGLCDLVYVRDKRSQGELASYGISAGYAPDMTFFDPIRSNVRPRSGAVAITDSVFKKYTQDVYQFCQRNKNVSYAPMIRSRLEHGRNKDNALKVAKESLYVGLLKMSGGRFPVRQYYKNLLFQRLTPEAYIDYLAEHEAVVCYRFHAMCFCLQAGIPFLAVKSNSWKVEALLEEIGLPLEDRLVSHDALMTMSSEDIVAKARFSDDERKAVDSFVQDARRCNVDMFSEIEKIL